MSCSNFEIDYKKLPCNFTPCEQDKEPEKWMQLRTTGIGGSDAGAIMGMNKYASPFTVYMQKKGIEGFTGNNATEWGHILEDPIRQKAAQELNAEIEAVPGMYTSKVHPFMNANIDGLIYFEEPTTISEKTVSGLGGHEIKTTNGDGFSANEIPDSYYCQIQHYMAVTGLDWFILTAFFLPTRTGKHYLVSRNDIFIEKMIEKESEFWTEYVEKNIIPEPTGVDAENLYLKSLPTAENVVLDDDALQLIEEERKVNAQIKEYEKQHEALKEKIILAIYLKSEISKTADKTTATVGNYKVTYNTQKRVSVDTDLLKKSGLFESYSKESVSKVLRISEVKA